ncbi:trehalase family glycosidase [Pedobacter sp. SYP-B3415]|uniref:MGH1-like glycoside hydrolase domain-containing protein n=1 Tax=Pedobacter sp. SYP-B3415 TaxID=2496641 RepID=UPI00101C06FA|nr:trehalase family glycosidase [Pedobacter sp. SYP-B3415]
MRDKKKYTGFILTALLLFAGDLTAQSPAQVLEKYVRQFNAADTEAVKNAVPNAHALQFLADNVPLLECPDETIEKTYYFRWWSFRKHLKKTPEGYIITEFIEPVKHAGKYNSISCAAGHHLYEGRWLKNQEYLRDYIRFWLYHADQGQTKPRFHQFSSWFDDAVYNWWLVQPDHEFLRQILPALDADYSKWEQERRLSSGLFWQHDVKDGMEESVSGSRKDENRRPSINAYMYGNARALASIGRVLGVDTVRQKYQLKAEKMEALVQDSLWDNSDSFFKTRPAKRSGRQAREAIGFIPWYFNLPDDRARYAKAWDQLVDTAGFKAPWGLTTAERREPTFRTRGSGHGCEWDGALWPFATSQTLKGLSNLLTNYKQHGNMTRNIFYAELKKYAASHQMDGRMYIGEYQDEKTGAWLKGDHPRSAFYNHSTFCDLVISDLIGFKPAEGDTLIIDPLLDAGTWPWFSLTRISYHGREISVFWDQHGQKYGKGKGMFVYADGKLVARASALKKLTIKI